MEVFTKTSYSEYDQTQTIYHRYEPIGYKIVSEDGTVLQEIIVNEARDNNLSIDAVVMHLGDNTYFVITTYGGESGKDADITNTPDLSLTVGGVLYKKGITVDVMPFAFI